ncbi:type II toxin-antitoxin system VapC family toxin [Phycicoccus flavus]|uniref:type II toxin-antitoxin system VapC family toxin n=1 Tax=Phycicoccus flavus TaxID=2502783 RepID=UPI000FEBF006|nr:type II toxin-antitoxin system VapC family toxin [Phycicoccus flavus]NHA70113.1 type II toxin-antitoxin system VapC family toxin [Phycicoccus flavus]
MIVPDASVTVLLFGNPAVESRVAAATNVLRDDPDWLVPEHWRVEVLSVVRSLASSGKLHRDDAEGAVLWLQAVIVATAPTSPHVARIWELRSNLSSYDAAYVAVAESHDLTFVTADARIERAGVARCPIHLIA